MLLSSLLKGLHQAVAQPWYLSGSRGCIFETCSSPVDTACSLPAFAEHRSRWPCSAAACSVLLGRKMHQLVSALLGSNAHIFNDQVIGSSLAGRVGCGGGRKMPSLAESFPLAPAVHREASVHSNICISVAPGL